MESFMLIPICQGVASVPHVFIKLLPYFALHSYCSDTALNHVAMVELHISDNQLSIHILQTNLDMASIDAVKSSLKELQPGTYDLVRVDLSRVEFIDSTGLGFLLTLNRLLVCREQRIILVNPRKMLVEVLVSFRLIRLFEIEEMASSTFTH